MHSNALTFSLALLAAACTAPGLQPAPPLVLPGPVLHVIHVSVDGLRPDAIDALGPDGAPAFFRMRAEGATSDNARTDAVLAATLPDHGCQLTSRPVFGAEGHGFVLNTDLGSPLTLHLVKADYVASVFDVVHDSGFTTAFYASKSKFAVFERTWREFGAADLTGIDDGPDKMDRAVIDTDMDTMFARFLAEHDASPAAYTFVHLREPDSTGHDEGWDITPGSAYLRAVAGVDRLLGDLLAAVDGGPRRDSTVVIVTADHAGDLGTKNHVLLPAVGLTASAIIPFYVFGATVARGADLYALNPGRRLDPGAGIPAMSEPVQPIRNGDAGNLALQLLGLPPIPDSTINAGHDLAVRSGAGAP